MLFETEEIVTVGEILELWFKDPKTSVTSEQFIKLITESPILLALSKVNRLSRMPSIIL